jgi:protein ImuB
MHVHEPDCVMMDPCSTGSGGGGSRTSLCLWLPTFELRLELVRAPELDATSVALLSPGETAARREIWQVSERGAQSGVQPGMTVSRAVSLCPSLTLLEPDPTHYDAAMEAILETLGGLSPVVQPVDRGLFHVGMDGLGRLYGSPPRQVNRVLHALLEVLPRPLVAATRAGHAPGTFGARVAANSARPGAPVLVEEAELRPFLASRPIQALPLPDEALDRLRRLGISTLGELGRLPKHDLLRQFGPKGLEARALARGERIDPVRPVHRPRPIRVSLDFPSPVGEREALHRALDRLLDRGLARPERKDRAIRSLRLGGLLEGRGSWTVDVTLREPSARREVLAYPLRSRIRLSPPPRALENLFVEFFEFGRPAIQTLLFERREKGARSRRASAPSAGEISRALQEAVVELKLKLGHSPLYRVVEVDPWSRIPERRHALLTLEP